MTNFAGAATTTLTEALDAATELPAVLPGYAARAAEVAARPELRRSFLEGCRRIAGQVSSTLKGHGLVAVVEPRRGLGASALAAGLALGLAADPRARVLLVDADFDHPGLGRWFGVAESPGLADWINSGRPLRAVSAAQRNLLLLTAGEGLGTGERFHHELTEHLRERSLRERFDWVVVDGPPLLEAPSFGASIAAADYCVLAGAYRRTTISELRQAVELLPTGLQVGCVITGEASKVPGWIDRLL